MAENDLLKIDMLAYAKWVDLQQAADIMPMGSTINGFTLAGVKLVGDGSPQGKTAYLSSPYYEPPHSHAYDYHGYPVLTQDEMDHWVDTAYQMNAQILSHSNGDASADILLNAVEKADAKHGKEDRRTVVIHAQTTRLDQIKRMKDNAMIPSFFPAHTYFWGDFHRDSVLGPWRASNISPMGWANANDLPFTIHMDAPVLFPDMMTNMWSAVNRVTRSGDTLGEHHKSARIRRWNPSRLPRPIRTLKKTTKAALKLENALTWSSWTTIRFPLTQWTFETSRCLKPSKTEKRFMLKAN